MLKNTSTIIIVLTVISINTSYAMRSPTFSLKNNSSDTIQVDVKQNGKSLFESLHTIAPHKELPLHIDITNQNTILHLFFCPAKTDCTTEQKKLSTTFGKGKTIYIKFDGKKIEAQKGASSGQTTLGFSTAHNVTNNDFTVVTANIRSELVRSTSIRPISTQSAPASAQSKPARPTQPVPDTSSAQKPTKPAKPASEKKPYHDLAWAKFPEANEIKKNDKALMQAYYDEGADPRVRKMAQAVLRVTPEADSKTIDKAYYAIKGRYNAMPAITENKKLYDEIEKIIDTAWSILSK